MEAFWDFFRIIPGIFLGIYLGAFGGLFWGFFVGFLRTFWFFWGTFLGIFRWIFWGVSRGFFGDFLNERTTSCQKPPPQKNVSTNVADYPPKTNKSQIEFFDRF